MISRNSVGGVYPTRRLGEVVHFLDGMRRPVTESDRRAGPYPYYGANGIQGTIDGYLFDEPLVLLAEDGGHFETPERGIAYRVSGKTWVNNHAHVLRPKECVDLGFLCRVLENYDVTPWVTGTTRGKLTQAGAAQIEIPLPPLEEQRRIADILDKADELRAKRRAAIAKLDTLTQAIFLDMFGDPATNPKGWPRLPLADLSVAITDCPHSTPAWTSEGVICLRTSNLTAGGWDWTDTRYVSEADYVSRSSRGTITPGDIILSREGTVGIAAIVQEGMRVCMGQRLVQVRPDLSKLQPEYALRHLLHVLEPSRIGQAMVGSTSRHLNVKELRELSVPVPTLAAQCAFGALIRAIDATTQQQAASLSANDRLFDSLQFTAFRGSQV